MLLLRLRLRLLCLLFRLARGERALAQHDGDASRCHNGIGLCTACHQNVHDGYLIIQRQPNGTHLFFDKLGNRLDYQVDLEMAYWLDFEIGWKGGPEDSYKHRCGVDWTLFAG